jgi:hypothetical protein
MPPVADDDAMVENIIHKKAAAAGIVHDTSPSDIGTEFIDLNGFAVLTIDQLNCVLPAT